MADKDPNAEIEQLRRQLAELRREREAAKTEQAPQEQAPRRDELTSEEQTPASAVDEIIGEVDEKLEDLGGHIRELLDNLDEDLKTAKPSTLLIVFALGVLVGRMR
jgi:ABC-type transporter Mla subunit MlaD